LKLFLENLKLINQELRPWSIWPYIYLLLFVLFY